MGFLSKEGKLSSRQIAKTKTLKAKQKKWYALIVSFGKAQDKLQGNLKKR